MWRRWLAFLRSAPPSPLDHAKRQKWEALGRLKQAEEQGDHDAAVQARIDAARWQAEVQRLSGTS